MANEFEFDEPQEREQVAPSKRARQAPKSSSYIVLIVVAGLVVAGLAGGLYLVAFKATKKKEEQERPPEIVKLSVSEFYTEYTADPAAAKKKYAGKILEIQGVVMTADDINSVAHPQIVLRGLPNEKPFAALVSCMFPLEDAKAVCELIPGQTATVRGQLKSDTQKVGVPLTNGELVEAGPSPAVRITVEQLAKEYAADKEQTKKKYEEKQMVLEATVLDTRWNERDQCVFTVAGFDVGALEPIRLTIEFGYAGLSHTENELGSVRRDQVVRIKGEAGFPESKHPFTLYKAILLK